MLKFWCNPIKWSRATADFCPKIAKSIWYIRKSGEWGSFGPRARYLPVVPGSQNWSHFFRLIESYVVCEFRSDPIKWSRARADNRPKQALVTEVQ